MKNELYIVIGAYGSGKSEYSIHMARKLMGEGLDVVLADMDVVNPYFRSRDVKDEFAAIGIDVIAPEGAFKHADLPMLSPRIKGAIQNQSKTVILDVGGDPAGCRTLGRFEEQIKARGYRMLHVVNTLRPFTTTAEEILTMKQQLEFTSHLQISEFVCNTNLMEYTTPELVEDGLRTVKQAADTAKLPLNTYLVLSLYASRIPDALLGLRREVMDYTLSKPWEMVMARGLI